MGYVSYFLVVPGNTCRRRYDERKPGSGVEMSRNGMHYQIYPISLHQNVPLLSWQNIPERFTTLATSLGRAPTLATEHLSSRLQYTLSDPSPSPRTVRVVSPAELVGLRGGRSRELRMDGVGGTCSE